MSKKNRERREQKRLSSQSIPKGEPDYALFAEAVHRAVCFYEPSPCGECLSYAIIACAWLNRYSGIPHAIAGGYFSTVLGEDPTVRFEHWWVMRGKPGNWTYLDFATRHNPELLRNGFAKRFPNKVMPDMDPSIGRPYYVGDGKGLPWEYIIVSESSVYGHQQYRECLKVGGIHGVELVSKYYRELTKR